MPVGIRPSDNMRKLDFYVWLPLFHNSLNSSDEGKPKKTGYKSEGTNETGYVISENKSG